MAFECLVAQANQQTDVQGQDDPYESGGGEKDVHGRNDPDQSRDRECAQEDHENVAATLAGSRPEVGVRAANCRWRTYDRPICLAGEGFRSAAHRHEPPCSRRIIEGSRDRRSETVRRGHQRRAGPPQHVELAVEGADRVFGLAVSGPSEKARSKDHRPHQHEDNENHDRQDPLTCLPVVETLLRDLLHLVDGRDGNDNHGSLGTLCTSQSVPSLQDEPKHAGRNGDSSRRKNQDHSVGSDAWVSRSRADTHRVIHVAQREHGDTRFVLKRYRPMADFCGRTLANHK